MKGGEGKWIISHLKPTFSQIWGENSPFTKSGPILPRKITSSNQTHFLTIFSPIFSPPISIPPVFTLTKRTLRILFYQLTQLPQHSYLNDQALLA